MKILQQVQDESQNDEDQSNPLGHASQSGIQGLGLALAHEGISGAGDGTGQTGGLTGLQQNDSNQEQGSDHFNDGQNNRKSVHNILRNAKALPHFRPAAGQIKP